MSRHARPTRVGRPLACQQGKCPVMLMDTMPLLDLDLARRITEGIVGLLRRYAPESAAQAATDDHPAGELADRLQRRDVREVLYLPDLEPEPRWPALWDANDANHERVFIRVLTERARVEYASAVVTGSLVHWERAIADPEGNVVYAAMDPDRHWSLKLEPAETVAREMGLTLIPPAAIGLRFGPLPLRTLLDPRAQTLRHVGEDVARLAESLRRTKGIRSPAQAYQRVLDVVRLGYDLGTLSGALDGRTPASLAELHTWLEEREQPFAWTRAAS